MRLILWVMALWLGAGTPAQAGFFTGWQLLEKCESDTIPRQLACVFYLAGAVDASQTHHLLGDISQQFCLDKGVDIVNLRQVYTRYAREHPEELNLPATGIALNSFISAFPCA